MRVPISLRGLGRTFDVPDFKRTAQLGTWPPMRQRLAALAVLVATSTGAVGAVLGGVGLGGTVMYVAVTIMALVFPAWIAVQVMGGQWLIATLLVGPDGVGALFLLPMLAGVVATAELLAAVARLDTPLGIVPRDVRPGTVRAIALAASVFVVVAAIGAVPGPTGLLAVVLASGACVLLATRLTGRGS